MLFGTFWGGWAVAAADVERALGLGHGRFGVLLSIAMAGAAVANVAGGVLAERVGTDRALAASFLGWAALLGLAAAAQPKALLAVALIGAIALGGVVDVVMNVAATAGLAGDAGGLVRFHARFNAGAAIGAVAMGLLVGHGVSWRFVWAAIAAGAVVLAAVLRRVRLPAGGAGDVVSMREVATVLRREHLVLIAAAFAVGAMVEGGVELWGVLHLRRSLSGGGLLVGASSAVAGYLVAMTARIALGPVAGRRGPVAGVAIGATTAVAGIVVLATSPVAVVAGIGLVLAAGGISLCWPLLLSFAAAGRERPGTIVGAVTSVGYLGFVLGPSLVGSVAGAVGLRAGLLVLAAAAMFVAIAPLIAQRRRGGGTGAPPAGTPPVATRAAGDPPLR